MPSTWDFFISYVNDADDPQWAEWIARTLEDAGYSTRLQAWDMGAAGNFVLDMDEFLRGSGRLIMVLSPSYLSGRPMADAEWSATFVEDPVGKNRQMVPVMVRDCQPTGLLGPRVYVKIFGMSESDARDTLLAALVPRRPAPGTPVPFPGP